MVQLRTGYLVWQDGRFKDVDELFVLFALESLFVLVEHLSLDQSFVDSLQVFGLEPESFQKLTNDRHLVLVLQHKLFLSLPLIDNLDLEDRFEQIVGNKLLPEVKRAERLYISKNF